MSYFDFTYGKNIIYSCKNEHELWFCIKNLSLPVVKQNFQNGKIENKLNDPKKIKEAKFIISERICSLNARKKNPKAFPIRNGQELPKKFYELDISELCGEEMLLRGSSKQECPNCKCRMLFVKRKLKKKKELWCPECDIIIENGE